MLSRNRASLSVVLGSLLIVAIALPAQAALPVRNPPCGKVVTKSFKLGGNMDCTGDGLVVGKAGITIHLNGKRIRGDGDADDYGILNEAGYADVTVRNGRVVDFDDGIRIEGALRNTIRRVRANNNASDGLEVNGGRKHHVRFVIADGNGDDGIDVGANRSVILDSKTRNNGEDGIDVAGNDNVLRRNYACGNALSNYDLSGTFISTKNTEDAAC